MITLLVSTILVVVYAFKAFAGETFVARVTAQQVAPMEFELTYWPANTPESEAIHARLEGDQWMISGGMVKWHPWLTMLGLKSYYRPLRLTGQFSKADLQRSHLPTLALLAPEVDRF